MLGALRKASLQERPRTPLEQTHCAYVPVPLRPTFCGLPPPLSLTETLAVRLPLADGVKVTVTEQLAVHEDSCRDEHLRGFIMFAQPEEDAMANRSSAAKKAAQTRKRRAAGKKAARTRKLSTAGKKAVLTRKRREAGRKAAATRKRKREHSSPAPSTPQAEAQVKHPEPGIDVIPMP